MSLEPPQDGPRLLDAMPRPLLVVFALACLVALVASLFAILSPPTFETVRIEDRRPPPAGSVTHGAGEVFPAPTPTVDIPYDPPCDEVATVTVLGGVSFTERVEDALALVCTVARGGPSPTLTRAVAGLEGATIRIAEFEVTGVESQADRRSKVVSVNLKFTERRRSARELAPVLLHEAWHLANADEPVTAAAELDARAVEVAACREFITLAEWPRWCEDARALTTLPRADALALLVEAGYPA